MNQNSKCLIGVVAFFVFCGSFSTPPGTVQCQAFPAQYHPSDRWRWDGSRTSASLFELTVVSAALDFRPGLLFTASCNQQVNIPLTKARSAKDGKYISWKEHRIDDEGLTKIPLRGADGLVATDLDGDGRLDVVSVHEDSSHVRIAFGTGKPDQWILRTLAEGETVKDAEDVAVGDVDGDKRADIVVAAEQGHVVVFLAPKDAREMKSWKPVIINATRNRGSWIRVRLADIDKDGRLEIFAANKGLGLQENKQLNKLNSFSYFRLGGNADDPNAWKEHVIGKARMPINIRPFDIDGDGDLDVVGCSWTEERIILFENPGDNKNWVERTIHQGPPSTVGFMLAVADLDGDKRLDIIAGSGPRSKESKLFWLRQPEDLKQTWKPHNIGSFAPDKVTGLALLDVNDDGRLDLFVGGYSWGERLKEPEDISPQDSCGRLAWFEQPEKLTKVWLRHNVSRRRRGMFDMFAVADVNGDGLKDLITTRGNSGSFDGVLWLEQIRSAKQVPAFRPSRAQDSPEVPLPERPLP